MSRRRFLTVVGAVSAATGMSPAAVAAALDDPSPATAAGLTTLSRTLRPGNVLREGARTAYRAVTEGAGEPHLVRTDLADPTPGRESRRRSLVHLLHLTDQHITDAESPLRLESVRDLERDCAGSDLPARSAHRHHETAGAHIVDAMNARARAIGYSPVTGAPIQAAITTGDNADNAQVNEIGLHIGLMNGGPVDPGSGAPAYEGVQNSGDPAYWHPDGAVDDVLRVDHGFPVVPTWLEDTVAPFEAVGVGVPWFTCYGNHDALVQGNFPMDRGRLMDAQLLGDEKLAGFPELPDGTNTCSLFGLMGGVAQAGGISALVDGAPTFAVTPDPTRMFADRRRWVEWHLASSGFPNGHGLSAANLGQTEADSQLYYTADVGQTRWIVLDTTNPGGLANGSIGTIQLAWLEAELTRADEEERLVLLFSHHGLRSLDNGADLLPLVMPDDFSPNTIDPERRVAPQVEAVVERHPCVIAWINGHSHVNTVVARDGFWDIGTAAHIDWPGQSRLVEVVDNGDGTLSILCTMIDHEDDGAHVLAGEARELMMNEPLGGWQGGGGTHGSGTGQLEDRNVELLVTDPFPGRLVGATERASSRRVSPPVSAAGGFGSGALDTKLSVAGALAVAGAVGIKRLRERGEHPASVTQQPPRD